jgi:hypothetical protein
MDIINRVAVSISVKQKFVDWVNQIPNGDIRWTLAKLNEDKSVYLIPSYEDSDAERDWFRSQKMRVLEEALESICTEKDRWPKDLSDKIFDDYLSAEFHPMVWDLASDEPIEHEEL